MVFPFGVAAIASLIPTLIRGPAVFVAVEIGVTHPAPLDGLLATYTIGVPGGVAGAGVELRAPVSAGAMTETAATTAAHDACPGRQRGQRVEHHYPQSPDRLSFVRADVRAGPSGLTLNRCASPRERLHGSSPPPAAEWLSPQLVRYDQ
jgi:hypothetical protein